MIGVVVAAHGEFAEALIHTAYMVVPASPLVAAVSIHAGENGDAYTQKLERKVSEFLEYGGVLILTDMFGGTPCNIGLTLHQPGKVEVLTGVNLPMLIRAVQLSEHSEDLASMAREVREAGSRSITVASDVLTPVVEKTKEPRP